MGKLKKLKLLLNIQLWMYVLSCFSRVQLFATPWTVACQALLSMVFSRQVYWSGMSCPPPGYLPDPGIKPTSLMSLALAGRFFTTSATWEALSWGHFLSISDAWQDLEVKTCHLPSHPGFPRETWRSLSKVKVTLGALPPHGTRLRGQTTLGWPRPL